MPHIYICIYKYTVDGLGVAWGGVSGGLGWLAVALDGFGGLWVALGGLGKLWAALNGFRWLWVAKIT